MPIYEYQCPGCGRFELMQKISEPAVKRCPVCNKKVTKLISNTSFRLKGNGWYVTDYAPKNGDRKADESKAAETPVSKETKSESGCEKPANKTKEADAA